MDVRMYLAPGGGEIDVENGLFRTDQGLDTAALISWFGGNEDDDATDATDAVQYWGNLLESDESRHIRSRLAYLLRTLPLNSATLQRLQEAAEADVAWMLTAGIVDEFPVEVSIAAPKRVRIEARPKVRGDVYPFEFERTQESEL